MWSSPAGDGFLSLAPINPAVICGNASDPSLRDRILAWPRAGRRGESLPQARDIRHRLRGMTTPTWGRNLAAQGRLDHPSGLTRRAGSSSLDGHQRPSGQRPAIPEGSPVDEPGRRWRESLEERKFAECVCPSQLVGLDLAQRVAVETDRKRLLDRAVDEQRAR